MPKSISSKFRQDNLTFEKITSIKSITKLLKYHLLEDCMARIFTFPKSFTFWMIQIQMLQCTSFTIENLSGRQNYFLFLFSERLLHAHTHTFGQKYKITVISLLLSIFLIPLVNLSCEGRFRSRKYDIFLATNK